MECQIFPIVDGKGLEPRMGAAHHTGQACPVTAVGFEPTTSSTSKKRSTTELSGRQALGIF